MIKDAPIGDGASVRYSKLIGPPIFMDPPLWATTSRTETLPFMSQSTRGWAGLLMVALLLISGCSRSPEAQKARHLERGDKYAAREQYHEAILEYRNVLGYDPANTRAIKQIGLAHYQLGEVAQAFPYLLKAQEITPDDVDVRLKLGAIYYLAGKRAEAREAALSVLGQQPKTLDALALLADTASTPEEIDAAVQRLEEAQADLGDRATLHLALGALYLRKQDPPRAEAAFREAVAKEPKSVEAQASGRYDEALGKLNEALKGNPQNLGAQMLMAIIYERKGDFAKSQQTLEKILVEDPRFAPAANNLAWLYLEHGGDKERALELAQRAKEVAPDNPHISDTLGWILYQRGLYQRAASLLKESAAKLPDNPEIQYHLGLASLKIGDTAAARKALSAAVNSSVSFTGKDEARRALAELN